MDGTGISIHRLPRRTALVYLAVAAIWIVISDLIVAIVDDVDERTLLLNMAKGLGFVLFTSAVLYVVLRAWASRVIEGWEAAVEAQDRFAVLVEDTDDIIVVLDDDRTISYVSPSVERVLGWSATETDGARGRTFVHPDDQEAAIRYLAGVREGTGPLEPQTFRFLTPEGRWRHIEVIAKDLRHHPSVAGVVVHGRDVTDRRLVASRLEHALTHDPVTGLANRARFEDDLRDVSLGVAARQQDLVVLVIDLNAFREVNDAVGRIGGDEVLRAVAQRIERSVQPAAIGRLGADEFGIALPLDHTGPDGRRHEDPTRLAQQVIDELSAPMLVAGQKLRLSADIGGAVVPPTSTPEQALLAAETNLQQAKRHPDRVVITVLAPGSPAQRGGARLAGDLHDALARGELMLFYQPQYDLATNRVVAVEALLRWNHPTDGVLGPRSFLAEATRGTLLPRVTRFVLAEATRQAAIWRDAGNAISVSVNLSLGDLRRRSIVEEVLSAVRDSGISADLLHLELTEQTLLTEPERSLLAMRELRERGIQFSIDDFGTGYSSLVHLRTLPVHELKIDRTFVAGMCDGGIDDAIVSAVLDLGHSTDLTIVAEGIETIEAYRALAARGCDRGQGHLMAHALPADELSFAPFESARYASRAG